MQEISKGELAFVRLLLPLILGISVAFLMPVNVFVLKLLLSFSGALFISLWFSISYYNQYKIYLSRWKPGIIAQLFVFFIGATITLSTNDKLLPNHFSHFNNEALVVSIATEPKLSGDILRFEAKVKQGLFTNKFSAQSGALLIALKLDSVKNNYQYGDELLIKKLYTEVDPPYNPYEFDYKAFLANHEIYHQAFINESQIKVLARRKGNVIVDYALTLRKKMVLKYGQYIHDKEAASVASTLILGYKAELSREVLSAYSKTGTMHVLSVSGMHVGIVFFILNKLLWFMDRSKKLRVLRAVIIITLIWFYALITGFSPSVCRAALMLSMYVLGKAVNRSSNSYNLVAMSAFFLLIYNPYFLLDVGFQLSYLAVLGLIYFYPKIYNLLYVKNWLGNQIWSYTALSCAAQLATFPLGMYYFHQFPVYFLISNLFIVLPVIVIMYVGIAFLFIPWEVILKPLGDFLELGIIWMDKGLFFLEQLPFATYSSYYNIFYYLLLYLIIGSIMLALKLKNKRILYGSFCLAFMLFCYQSVRAIETYTNRSITFYSLRKNIAFSFFDGDKAFVYSDVDSSDKALAFSVHAAVQAQSDKVQYINLKDDKINRSVFYKNNFLKFRNFEMLIWNKKMTGLQYRKQASVDVVLISDNPNVRINEIVSAAKFKVILIDGTNRDYKIKRWVSEAADLSLNCYVLKKNPAYTINLE